MTADTTYVITIDGMEKTRFVVRTDLGALNAQTSFRAAPIGGLMRRSKQRAKSTQASPCPSSS